MEYSTGLATSCHLRGIRLLLIEDNAPLAEATADFIASAGLEVCVADCGKAGLQTAIAFQPQIVMCDLRLPEMSGLEIARALRRNARTKDILFVLHTSMDETDIEVFEGRVDRNEINLFLPKPITAERLDELIAALDVLRKRSA
jgi:DNA-binding response OmpR family regulator